MGRETPNSVNWLSRFESKCGMGACICEGQEISAAIDEINALRARIAELEAQLAESIVNDRTAMGYLSIIRKIVGGDDFPDMLRRVAILRKDTHDKD